MSRTEDIETPTAATRSAVFRRAVVLALLFGGIGLATWGWRSFRSTDHGTSAFEGLPQDRQEEIWDAEHVTFGLETHVGKPFAAALRDRDVTRLAAFLTPEFEARVLTSSPRGRGVNQGGVSEQCIVGAETVPADGAEFCRYLLGATVTMDSTKSGRLRILKIRRDEDDDSRWHLYVLLHLVGFDREGRHVEYESHADVVCVCANDDEIKRGDVIAAWDVVDQTLRGADAPLFEELTAQLGLDVLPLPDNWTMPLEYVRQYSTQYALDDYDADGDLDIAAATADGECFVFRRDPDRFVNVSAELGILPEADLGLRSYLAHWIDVNSDGFPELLLGSRLYANDGGAHFTPYGNDAGIRIKFNPMGATIADYDGDGLTDIYVLYQRQQNRIRTTTPAWVGDDDSGATNQLWRNTGDGRFEDVTTAAQASGGTRHSFAAAWHHANDDLLPDLYVANDFGGNSLLINTPEGRFEDASEAAGVSDFATSMGVTTGDLDNDGFAEVYVANMFSKMGRRIIGQVSPADYPEGIYEQLLGSCAGNRLYSQRDGKYRENSEQLGVNQVGWAYAPAMLDVDGDGNLDMYATCGFMSFDRTKPDG